ncbi:MAG: hypothetical protein AB1393_01895 [Candidatus Edwardsbacteria bacterium]
MGETLLRKAIQFAGHWMMGLLAGYTKSYGAGSRDVYLVRTDSLGDTLWTKTHGDAGDSIGWSVDLTKDGGFIIAGSAGFDVYLIKTNSLGDSVWTKTYGGVYKDYGYSIQQTQDSGFIITGSFGVFNPNWGEEEALYLVKTNASGDTLWTRIYGNDTINNTWPDGSEGMSVQ